MRPINTSGRGKRENYDQGEEKRGKRQNHGRFVEPHGRVRKIGLLEPALTRMGKN